MVPVLIPRIFPCPSSPAKAASYSISKSTECVVILFSSKVKYWFWNQVFYQERTNFFLFVYIYLWGFRAKHLGRSDRPPTLNMDPLPENSDIPFPHQAALEDPLKVHGVSWNEQWVTCHMSERTFKFPRPYHSFISLLLYINSEITQSWEKENEEDQVYWISLRAYLNHLLQNTLTVFKEKQPPMALACWLHREFMLCHHDEAGRREYLSLMEMTEIAPYSVDIFELGEIFSSMCQLIGIHSNTSLYYNFLDWFIWWKTQTDNGYYKSPHFERFGKLLKRDWKILKAATSSQLWNDMEEEESNHPFFHIVFVFHNPGFFSHILLDSGLSCSSGTSEDVPMLPSLKSKSVISRDANASTEMEHNVSFFLLSKQAFHPSEITDHLPLQMSPPSTS